MNARVRATFTLSLFTLSLAACGGSVEEFDGGEGIDPAGDGDTGDGDGDGDGPTDLPSEPICEVDDFTLDTVTPNVMLVLDKSGSMKDHRWDHDGDSGTPKVTRWWSLHGVVAEVTTGYADAMNFGVTLFPAIDSEYAGGDFESSCKVSDSPDVAVAAGTSAAILGAIPSADDEYFSGATPATEGVLTGASHLEGLGDEAPAAMVLITDGAANCVSPDNFVNDFDESLEDAVRDAWEGAGIPTYVVGIDIGEQDPHVDVNPREALEAVAEAGGVAQDGASGFYDASDPAALESALDEIAHRLGCQIELDFAPEPYAEISIEVDGVEIPQVDSCAGLDGAGWVQIDPVNNPTMIELCNSACADTEVAGGSATMCPVIP